jgi:hypothetical protein
VLAVLACAGGTDEHPLSATATVVATVTTIAGATPVMPIARGSRRGVRPFARALPGDDLRPLSKNV